VKKGKSQGKKPAAVREKTPKAKPPKPAKMAHRDKSV
jgi:hypothetical protein